MAMKNNWCTCDGDGKWDGGLTRRNLMKAAVAGGIGAVWWAGSKTALAQTSVRKNGEDGNVLVSVFLRGGADGLSFVSPYAEDDYYKSRPSLGIKHPKSGVPQNQRLTDLDGFFGLSPALLPLLPYWESGEAAFVHAVGSGDGTHSHFQAMNTMERGLQDQEGRAGGGWLARHLNMTEGTGSPLRGVAVSSFLPDSLVGASHATAIASMNDFRLERSEAAYRQMLKALYADGDDTMAASGRGTLEILDALNGLDPAEYKPERQAVYPDTPVGRAFRQVAFLIRQDIGLEVACIDADSWDTHVTQGTTDGWLFGLVRDLALSIAALHTDLGKEMSRVTVSVQTEFGRRVAENSGLGTDHGAGGLMILSGGGVKGGKVYGDWPGLVPDKLTGPGDLKITTDYRDVLTELLSQRLGNPDPSKVFPELRHKPVGVFA